MLTISQITLCLIGKLNIVCDYAISGQVTNENCLLTGGNVCDRSVSGGRLGCEC